MLGVTNSHLFAIYSGGELSLDGAGYDPTLKSRFDATAGPGQGSGEESYL